MVNSFEKIPARERVIVALDCDIEEAFDLADQLQDKASWMKVGMTLFYANGPAIVYALKERGFKVFSTSNSTISRTKSRARHIPRLTAARICSPCTRLAAWI